MAATNSFPESDLVGWLAALPASEKVHVVQQRYLLQYRSRNVQQTETGLLDFTLRYSTTQLITPGTAVRYNAQ
jgi:hypothetical protein